MTYKDIQKNEVVNAYIKKGNDNLGVLGYTDHSSGHSSLVAEMLGTKFILRVNGSKVL